MILARGPASPGPTSPLPQGWVTGTCCRAFVWVIWTQVLALAQPMLYSASHFFVLFFFNVLCRECLLFGYGTQHSVALVESVWCTVFWSLLPSNGRLRHTPQAVLSGLVQIYFVTFAQGQKISQWCNSQHKAKSLITCCRQRRKDDAIAVSPHRQPFWISHRQDYKVLPLSFHLSDWPMRLLALFSLFIWGQGITKLSMLALHSLWSPDSPWTSILLPQLPQEPGWQTTRLRSFVVVVFVFWESDLRLAA